jgi:hypothetical protein
MKTSLSSPTRYEQERIEAMLRLGCVACAHLHLPYSCVELHHILQGNVRMGHWYTIPLCTGHHRNTSWSREQFQLIPAEKRISIAHGRKAFTRYYPSERELWERVQNRLHLPAVWPSSKIVPRRSYVEGAAHLVEGTPSQTPPLATTPSPDRLSEVGATAGTGPETAAAGAEP